MAGTRASNSSRNPAIGNGTIEVTVISVDGEETKKQVETGTKVGSLIPRGQLCIMYPNDGSESFVVDPSQRDPELRGGDKLRFNRQTAKPGV